MLICDSCGNSKKNKNHNLLCNIENANKNFVKYLIKNKNNKIESIYQYIFPNKFDKNVSPIVNKLYKNNLDKIKINKDKTIFYSINLKNNLFYLCNPTNYYDYYSRIVCKQLTNKNENIYHLSPNKITTYFKELTNII